LDLLVERKLTPSSFVAEVEAIQATFPPEYSASHLLLVGSHDTPRIATLSGDPSTTWLIFFLLFGYPGAPVVFYGDEIGLKGEKDPDCRRAFEWDSSQWDQTLHQQLKSLIDLRRGYSALRLGSFQNCSHDDETGMLLNMRRTTEQTIWQVANTTSQSQTYRLPLLNWGLSPNNGVRALLADRDLPVVDGIVHISLEGYGGEFLLQT
jgi:glycosidase